MQKVGAVICCVCMYLIGGPLGLSLLLLTDLLVPGELNFHKRESTETYFASFC